MEASSRGRCPGDDFALMERKMVTQTAPTGDMIQQLYRITIVRTPWFSVKLHKILASDVDRYLHDHPWHYLSLMLAGSYIEERLSGVKIHHPGSLREWGFHTPDGWEPFYEVASGDIVHLP